MRSKKLLVVSHACVTTTNQQFYAELERLTGWTISILTPQFWRNDYSREIYPERWTDFQGELLPVPVWRAGSIPLHVYRGWLHRLLHEQQPDAIYIHNEPYSLAAFQIYLANRISVNCPIGFYSAQNILKQYPFPFSQTERVLLQNSQFAFPVSQDVAKVLHHKGYQGALSVLPLGIDPQLYFPHPHGVRIAQQLKTQKDEILIGYIGRITEEKGLQTLVQSLSGLEDLNWRLIIIGAGSYKHHLESLIDQYALSSRVCWLGYVPHVDVAQYLTAFDVLVLPSETRPNWKEQFGRVIIEALACGTPVLGSDSGEIPHLINRTQGGLIFQEGQPDALARQLRRLLLDNDLRAAKSQSGRQSVLHTYTQDNMVEQFANVIEKSLDHSEGMLAGVT